MVPGKPATLGGLDTFAKLGDMLAEVKPLAMEGAPAEIPLDDIYPDPDQPRKIFDEEALQELSASIREQGVFQPIGVIADGNGKYKIAFGERRWRASKMAGKTTIPCVIRKDADPYVQAAENIQKEGFQPIEIVSFIEKRKAEGDSLSVIAKGLGKPLPWVSKYAALINWSPYIARVYGENLCSDVETLYLLVTLNKQAPTAVQEFCDAARQSEDVGRAAAKALKAKIQAEEVARKHQEDRQGNLLGAGAESKPAESANSNGDGATAGAGSDDNDDGAFNASTDGSSDATGPIRIEAQAPVKKQKPEEKPEEKPKTEPTSTPSNDAVQSGASNSAPVHSQTSSLEIEELPARGAEPLPNAGQTRRPHVMVSLDGREGYLVVDASASAEFGFVLVHFDDGQEEECLADDLKMLGVVIQ